MDLDLLFKMSSKKLNQAVPLNQKVIVYAKIAHQMSKDEIKGKVYHHLKLEDVGVTDTYFMKDHYSGVKYLFTTIQKFQERKNLQA